MNSIHIKLGFSKFRDEDLDTKSLSIINSLTGNLHFPNPIPSLTDVSNSRIAFVNALSDRLSGGKNETAIKNQAREELEEKLKLLGLYVQANCNNNEVVALSSGYDIQKARKPVGILAKPTNFKVENGPVAGSLTLNSDKVEGAKAYVFEITNTPVTPDSVWKVGHSSNRNHRFEGLTSGTQYAVRMAGIGTELSLVYSDILSSYVL